MSQKNAAVAAAGGVEELKTKFIDESTRVP
jgi:hypothetical protein